MRAAASAPSPSSSLPSSPIVLDGVRVNHVDMGEGAPVVFLHGITATLGYYRANLPFFARSHRTLALDLPGFGRSDKPDIAYEMPYFVEVVRALLDAKGLERATLVGNSMGGLISMLFALTHPSRLERLVLVDPAGATAYPRRTMRFAVGALHALRVTHGEAQGQNGPLRWPPRVPAEAMRFLFRMVFPTQPVLADRYAQSYAAAVASGEYERLLRSTVRALGSVARHHVGPRAAEIAAPTLIVWGAKDRLLPPAAGGRLRRWIAGSRLLVYRDSGHCPMVDQPDRFNADVARFFRGEIVGE